MRDMPHTLGASRNGVRFTRYGRTVCRGYRLCVAYNNVTAQI